MPALHDLDPPAMTEDERLAKRRYQAASAFELWGNEGALLYRDVYTETMRTDKKVTKKTKTTAVCEYCNETVTQDGVLWIDSTNAEVCAGDGATGPNYYHQPKTEYRCRVCGTLYTDCDWIKAEWFFATEDVCQSCADGDFKAEQEA